MTMSTRLSLVSTICLGIQVAAKNATVEVVSSFAISGWWSDCDFEQETFAECCIGNYTAVDDPVTLDAFGNTCYVNPHAAPSSLTRNLVLWFGPGGSVLTTRQPTLIQPVYYYALLVPDEDVDTYLPTNCTDSGACSCEAVDPLRGSWRTTGNCSVDCASDLANTLAQGNCAVFLKTSTINNYFNDTLVTCAIQGSLIDLSSKSPSTEPRATPAPAVTSGKMKGSILSMSCIIGSSVLLVSVLL